LGIKNADFAKQLDQHLKTHTDMPMSNLTLALEYIHWNGIEVRETVGTAL
jgi:hypothetical protein